MPIVKRPGSRYLWARFQVAGRQYWKSTGETDKRKAAAVAAKMRAEIDEMVPYHERRGMTLKHLRDMDIQRALASGVVSTQSVTREWRHLMAFFRGAVDKIDTQKIIEYINRRRSNHSRGQTIRREIYALRRGLRTAKQKRWIREVPEFPRVRSDPMHPGRRGKLHPMPVMRQWLAALPQDIRDIAEFALMTGLRSEEIRRVRADWVEPGQKNGQTPAILRLPDTATKSRQERIVGLSQAALDIIKRRSHGVSGETLVFHQGDLLAPMRKACRAIGYKKRINLRDCRHMFATLGLAESGDATAVQAALGHTNLASTQRYMHSTVERTTRVGALVTDILLGE